jgi:hypothetical protein
MSSPILFRMDVAAVVVFNGSRAVIVRNERDARSSNITARAH